MNFLTPTEVKAILDAVNREVTTDNTWEEIKGLTLADICSGNQDALIDDLFENDQRDAEFIPGMVAHVKTYDSLLGTSRASELPASDCTCSHGLHEIAPLRGCFHPGCPCQGYFES